MPQLFQVLKCYKCFVFQVHQTKKSNKWECKLCGEKQSIKRHYGLGTGKECRLHVQKLNGVRGEIDELNINNTESDEEPNSEIISCTNTTQSNTCTIQQHESKWSDYVTNEPVVEENKEDVYLDGMQVVLEKPTKCRKLGNSHTKKSISKSVNSRCSDENISFKQNVCNSDLISNSKKMESFDKPHKQNRKQYIVPLKNSSKWALSEKASNFSNKATQIISKDNNRYSFPKNGYEIENIENTYCGIANNNEQTQCQLMNSKHIDEIDKNVASASVTFLQPKINKNSKWAQFTDISDSSNEDIDTKSASIIKGNPRQNSKVEALFSLCDDSDLDNVLDI